MFSKWVLGMAAVSALGLSGLAMGQAAPPAAPAAAPAVASGPVVVDAMPGAIAGTMDIVFNTRTTPDDSGDLKAGSAKLGVVDQYALSLSVAGLTEFSGTVERRPNLYSKLLARRKQDARLTYDLSLAVLNPRDLKQKRTVGKWVGIVPIDTNTGAFVLSGGKAEDRPMRIAIDTMGQAQGFESLFDGRLIGKAEGKENLASYTYRRLVGGKEIAVTVKRVDPMKFENIVLAMGPARSYPVSTVSGRLDYDYETGNYLTDGIRFSYMLDGKEVTDVLTGTIKWVEDPNREVNGKGRYEFNLRFNEEANKKATGEDAAFAQGMSEEDAFFAVDNSIPSLTGTIDYVDTLSGETVTASKVTFKLDANKLTRQQVVNFAKLWLVCVGPTNDE